MLTITPISTQMTLVRIPISFLFQALYKVRPFVGPDIAVLQLGRASETVNTRQSVRGETEGGEISIVVGRVCHGLSMEHRRSWMWTGVESSASRQMFLFWAQCDMKDSLFRSSRIASHPDISTLFPLWQSRRRRRRRRRSRTCRRRLGISTRGLRHPRHPRSHHPRRSERELSIGSWHGSAPSVYPYSRREQQGRERQGRIRVKDFRGLTQGRSGLPAGRGGGMRRP